MWSWLLEPCPRWVRLLHNPCSFAALVSRRRFGSRCMIPLRRDHCIRSTWSHTLLICVAKRMCSRHGRRVWRWWVGFERKGSGPLLPSRFLTDQHPFFPTKQHSHLFPTEDKQRPNIKTNMHDMVAESSGVHNHRRT
jgi:hypothetical protein